MKKMKEMKDPTFEDIIKEDTFQSHVRDDWDSEKLEIYANLATILMMIGAALTLLQYLLLFQSYGLGLVALFGGLLLHREVHMKKDILMMFERKLFDSETIDRFIPAFPQDSQPVVVPDNSIFAGPTRVDSLNEISSLNYRRPQGEAKPEAYRH